jgi:BirA family transcriptional regulator, biotin operon repressor / biotin---[acetyl-CoA-carboxylase] ligase
VADATIDGLTAPSLAAQLGLSACEVYDRIGSTMDLAHEAAGRGAAAGTLVIANAQDAGRGRGGRRWSSPPGHGLWMTLIERPASASGLDVLSLRVGLHVAEAIEPLAGAPVRLKWPNDLFAGDGKLAGILIEARWRDRRVEWVAIGLGLNIVSPTDVVPAAGLAPGVTRTQALERIIPAVRTAAAAEGPLTAAELSRYAARNVSVGRRVSEPAVGVVVGIAATGELVVDTDAGPLACRSGSLVYSEAR